MFVMHSVKNVIATAKFYILERSQHMIHIPVDFPVMTADIDLY